MQQIVNSPLQVERYYLKELNFKTNQDFEISPEDFDALSAPEIGIAASVEKRGKGKRKWTCELVIKTEDDGNTPYNFRIVLYGYFSISKEYPTENCELIAKVNCPSVLYSAAREMLMTTIRRSPFPPLILPTMAFLEVEDEVKSKEKSKKSK